MVVEVMVMAEVVQRKVKMMVEAVRVGTDASVRQVVMVEVVILRRSGRRDQLQLLQMLVVMVGELMGQLEMVLT